MTTYEIPLFVQGTALNSSQNNSVITYYLDPPLSVGESDTSLSVYNAEIWYSFPNISASRQNNTVDWNYQTVNYTYTFQDGLYNIDSINSNLRDRFTYLNLPTDLFYFTADDSTYKVSVELRYSTLIVVLAPNSIGNILGWSEAGGPYTFTQSFQKIYEAPQTASLNQVNRVMIHTNLCNGAYCNGKASDCIASVQINVGVGRQILYQPNTPLFIDVYKNQISQVIFYLTDENGNYLNCNGEYWSLTALLRIKRKSDINLR